MTFPTVIETPLRMESVTRDPFGDVAPSAAATTTATSTPEPAIRQARALRAA